MTATFRLAMVSDTNSIEDRNGLSPRQLRHRDVSRGLPRPPMLSLSMFHTDVAALFGVGALALSLFIGCCLSWFPAGLSGFLIAVVP